MFDPLYKLLGWSAYSNILNLVVALAIAGPLMTLFLLWAFVGRMPALPGIPPFVVKSRFRMKPEVAILLFLFFHAMLLTTGLPNVLVDGISDLWKLIFG